MITSRQSSSFPTRLLAATKSKVSKKISVSCLVVCMLSFTWWSEELLRFHDESNYSYASLYRNLSVRRQLLLEPQTDWIDENKIDEWIPRDMQGVPDPVNPVLNEASSQYKFLTFGTSITWGAGMKNRFNAYPFILGGRDAESTNVTNLAQRASGPGFPSICLESMLPENKPDYDVIILEFYMTSVFGLPVLARRLRQLYPNALIIVLQIWYPVLMQAFWTDGKVYSLMEWAKQVHGITDINDPRLITAMKDAPPGTFRYCLDGHPQHATKVALDLVGGVLYSLPKPEDPIEAIELYHSFFSSHDWHHLSEEGHAFVARDIFSFIQSHKNAGSSTPVVPLESAQVLEKEMTSRTSMPSDICYDWFETGETSLKFDDNLRMELILNRTDVVKFGLDFPLDTGGSFHITNPNPEDMALYLRYLVTGPAPSDYPNFSVEINGAMTAKDIDVSQHVPSSYYVHVVAASHVGTLQPGESVVTITSTEKDKKYPFRLVSVVLVKKEAIEWDDGQLPIDMENFMRTLFQKASP